MEKVLRACLFIITGLLAFQLSAQQQIVYIWGGPGNDTSEFNGGLNGWTTQGWSTQNGQLVEDPDVKWEWIADGSARKGAYSGGGSVIRSPSDNNGAAVFDSDYLDNGGVQGQFGKGPGPSPQRGLLISPVFDCTGHESVVVRFNQALRNYDSQFFLDVSTDSGKTWTPIQLNRDTFVKGRFQGINMANIHSNVELVDISHIAADQKNVQIRFRIEADYYYWIIDDVYVIEKPELEVSLGDCFYPLTYVSSPSIAFGVDTLFFACKFVSLGKKDAEVTVEAGLLDTATDAVLLTTTKTVQVVSSDSVPDSIYFVEFDDYLLASDLEESTNYLVYYQIKEEDYNLTDNAMVFFLRVNDNSLYNKTSIYLDDGILLSPTVAYRPSSATQFGFAGIFQTGDFARDYIITSAITILAGDDVFFSSSNNALEAYVLKFNANDPRFNDPLYEDFFGQGKFASVDDDNPYYSIVGYGDVNILNGQSFSEFEIPVENDVNQDEPLRLENNTMYALLTNVTMKTGRAWIGFRHDEWIEMFHYESIFPKAQIGYLLWADDGWFLPFIYPWKNPACKILIKYDPEIYTQKPELDASSVQLLPNIASDKVVVRYTFEKPATGQIVLTNAEGIVHQVRTLRGERTGEKVFSVQGLPAGQYLVWVNMDLGRKTFKLTVVH